MFAPAKSRLLAVAFGVVVALLAQPQAYAATPADSVVHVAYAGTSTFDGTADADTGSGYSDEREPPVFLPGAFLPAADTQPSLPSDKATDKATDKSTDKATDQAIDQATDQATDKATDKATDDTAAEAVAVTATADTPATDTPATSPSGTANAVTRSGSASVPASIRTTAAPAADGEAATYPLYAQLPRLKKYHKNTFPRFSLQNLTRELKKQYGDRHHGHGHGHDGHRGWWGHHHDGGDAEDGGGDFTDNKDGRALATYGSDVYHSGPSCVVAFAFLLLCCGCCFNLYGCFETIKQRRQACRAKMTGATPTVSACEQHQAARQARCHAKMQKGQRRWKLVLVLLVTMCIGSLCLFSSMHKIENRQYESLNTLQANVDSVAEWADTVAIRVDTATRKAAAANTLVGQGLASCTDNATQARLLQVHDALLAITIRLASPTSQSVGNVITKVSVATGSASEGVDAALHAAQHEQRSRFWGGFAFLFIVLWASLSLNLGSAFMERTRSRLCLNMGTSTCRLLTMWSAFMGAAAVLCIVLVVGDFCFDARDNLLMLTTNNDATVPEYNAFNYYLHCGGYNATKLADDYPFADTTDAVSALLHDADTALAAIPSGTCAVTPELATLMADIDTLTVGTDGIIPAAYATATSGDLQCAALNSRLESLLTTFCTEAYTPIVYFWGFFMWAAMLLCVSDMVQKCFWCARPPPSTAEEPGHHVIIGTAPLPIVINSVFEDKKGGGKGQEFFYLDQDSQFVPPAYQEDEHGKGLGNAPSSVC